MKKQIVIAAMALGLLLAQEVKANVCYVYGTVTSVSTLTPLIKVGDSVLFKINYTVANGNVTRLTVTVNDSSLNLARTNDGSILYVDEDPSNGTVQWNLSNGSVASFDVASNTPGGTIPCIDSFDLGRTFSVFFNNVIANGTVIAKPITRTGS